MSSVVAGTRGPHPASGGSPGQGGFADVLYRQPPSRDGHQGGARERTSEAPRCNREADAMHPAGRPPAVVELHGVGTTSGRPRLPGDGVLPVA